MDAQRPGGSSVLTGARPRPPCCLLSRVQVQEAHSWMVDGHELRATRRKCSSDNAKDAGKPVKTQHALNASASASAAPEVVRQ